MTHFKAQKAVWI